MSVRVLEAEGQRPIKLWVDGVPVEPAAEAQLAQVAALPFIHKWVAVMPDVHVGLGATVGSVIPTKGALIPAAVGVDLGCGMVAARTTLDAAQLPDALGALRDAIERVVPHGRTARGDPTNDRGAWGDRAPAPVIDAWATLEPRFAAICEKHPKLRRAQSEHVHLGTLGTGNHFVEVCLDEAERVWVMLHSGSRGVGHRIGQYFIERAKREMERWFVRLPNPDLAYLPESSPLFLDYVEAVAFAQDYAATNRRLMLDAVLGALAAALPPFTIDGEVVNCHHNYVARERHFGERVWVTRKGAVRAFEGDLGIIPGSMGARSYIVRGKGCVDAFCSSSHGAGRVMSRTAAKRRFTLADHAQATAGVECRKDADVLDETPGAYKSIDAVMAAQADLVDVMHTLKQVLCVKG
jgi:tRNA-splicing ligase RtcB